MDKNLDNRPDMVECEVCHQLYKKRGIKIHQRRSTCGEKLQTSQRNESKSEEIPTLEPNHRGRGIPKRRRVPFIASQTFHNASQKTPKKTESTSKKTTEERKKESEQSSWSDFVKEVEEAIGQCSPEKEEPAEETAQKILKKRQEESSWSDFVKEVEEAIGKSSPEEGKSEEPAKKMKQKKVTDWIIKRPISQRRDGKKEVSFPKKDVKATKLTKYYGTLVRGESGLGEWLAEMGKLSPEVEKTSDTQQTDSSDTAQLEGIAATPRRTKREREDSTRLITQQKEETWVITDKWDEETGETLMLADKDIEELRRVVLRGDELEVLADHHLHVNRKDIRSLYKQNYLNDTIVDEYLLMIKARNPEEVAVTNSYFYQKFDSLGLEEGFAQTRDWLKEDLRKKETILIPICKNDHWTLIHIDTKQRVVYYLDSIIGSRFKSPAPGLMKKFIEKYYKEKGEVCKFRVKVRRDIPCQHNGVDCGAFLCAFAERLSRKTGFSFNQNHMSLIRWKMTWEILNGSLKEWVQMKETASKHLRSAAGTSKPKEGVTVKKKKGRKGKTETSSTEEGRKKNIQWPPANSEEWKRLDLDLSTILRKIGNTAESKAELHPQIIYRLCLERFGEVESAKKRAANPSRRQTKGRKLREQISDLKNAWKEATEEEKPGIQQLQEEQIRKLRLLKRAESLKARRKKYKENTESFYKQPYLFARKVLDPEVKGDLKSSKEEVEEFLLRTHSDSKRNEELGNVEGLYEYPDPELNYNSEPPTWSEFQQVLKKARTKSSAGPNGVPYRFYKYCPGVAKLMFNYIRGLWRENKIPDTWRRAEGVLIPKEDGATSVEKFRTISLLNTEGKLFWKLKANKITDFITRNRFIDPSIQKGGIPGVSGCLEHTAILSHLIAEAKRSKLDLVSTWLDIANAYGSIAHLLLQVALERAHVPVEVRDLIRSYYERVEIRFTTKEFTTQWQRVEKGIITGCTLSVILFALTMTMLLASTKKETKGPVTISGQQQENARLYMDDVSTTTRTVTQTHHLLEEISKFFRWGRLEVKPSKCRALVLERGVPKKIPVYWEKHEITSVLTKEIKYLGKEYNFTLTDRQQMEKTLKTLEDGLKKIDRTRIAGKNKCWIIQNMLIPRLMWPLTIYDFPQSRVEGLERKVTAHLKKWLGIPKSLSTDLLYARSAMIRLPYSSIVEEVKVARVRTKVMLETSQDVCIKNADIVLDSGRKWKVSEAVADARVKLKMQDIAGIANIGREGIGINHRQYFKGSTEKVKKQLIVKKIREEEEERRLVRIAGLSQQSRSLQWGVQQRVMKDRDMRETPEGLFQFQIKVLYDLLPTPSNKNRWFRTEQYSCHLCGGSGTLEHILSSCKVALGQGRYTWRHDRVLREIGFWVDEKRKEVNAQPWRKRSVIQFVKAGEKRCSTKETPGIETFLKTARDWKIQVDLPESHLTVPVEIAATSQRPDIIITSQTTKQLFIVELTVPMESRSEISSQLKSEKYERGIAEAAALKGWKTSIYTVEVGCRGYPAPSLGRMLSELGYMGRKKREILKKIARTAEESSMKIWKSSQFKQWGRGE